MAEGKEQQWRRWTERSGRDLQEARPDNRQVEVNVGSWRCVGRKHQAVHPSRVTKNNSETTADLTRLRKSGQHGCKFPCTFEAQTHQGKRAKSERGRDLQNAKGSVSRRDARRTW